MRQCDMVRLTMETDTDLITSFEAGLILRKSARTVQRMARTEENPEGVLPVVTKLPGPNGAYLFRRSDVRALASEGAA